MKKIMMTLLALMFIFALSSASQAAVKATYTKTMPKSVCFEVTEEGPALGQQIVIGTKKSTKVEFPPNWDTEKFPLPFEEGMEEGMSVKANVHLVQAFSNIDPIEDDGIDHQGMGTGTGTATQYTGKDEKENKVDETNYHAEWHATYFDQEGKTWIEVFDLYWEFEEKVPSRAEIWIKDDDDGITRGYQLKEINCKTGETKYPEE